MALPQSSRKRASSAELDSILFSDFNSVATAQGSGTNSAGVSANAGRAPSSKRARTTTKKHQKGWDSAGKPAKHRTAQDSASKKPMWEAKLAKCKNKLARAVVDKAFAKNTPGGWKGKRFCDERDIVPEKEVMAAHLILSDEANISA